MDIFRDNFLKAPDFQKMCTLKEGGKWELLAAHVTKGRKKNPFDVETESWKNGTNRKERDSTECF